jgi:uncharacterized protein (DUF58 family)
MRRARAARRSDFIEKWVKWGAGSGVAGARARRKGARAHARPLSRVDQGHPALAKPILRHRVMTNFYAESERINSDAIVERLLETVPVRRAGCSPWPQARARRQFLDPAVVRASARSKLRADDRRRVPLRPAPQPVQGFSVEFAEYRQYMPATISSTIDWKVYARSDRHYVKKFEEETNLNCHIMLDVSGSMGYGSRGLTKFEYAQCLAASLAYLMNRQRDGVGLTAFDEGIVGMLPASARPGHLRAMLLTLERLTLGQKTNVSKPMHQLATSISKRGMVVLISDLLDEPERVIRGLKHFQFRGTDVVVFHVLDPHELEFPSSARPGSRTWKRKPR